MDNVASDPSCSTVPRYGFGTAGQSATGTEYRGTSGGTVTGTSRHKALQKLVFLRDKQRDKGRDTPAAKTVYVSHGSEPGGTAIGAVAAIDHSMLPDASCLPISIDLGELPTRPCSDCGRGLWWRLSTVERDGPGPWLCRRCCPPNPADWVDACSMPREATGHGST